MAGVEDKRLTQGWFSHRNKTSEALEAYREENEGRLQDAEEIMRQNRISRAARSPAQ